MKNSQGSVSHNDRNSEQESATIVNDVNNSAAGGAAGGAAAKQRRRKRRWGDAKTSDSNSTASNDTNGIIPGLNPSSSSISVSSAPPIDSKAKALALKESIKARLAALKAKTAPGGLKRSLPPPSPPPSSSAVSVAETVASSSSALPPPTKRAKHYELDMNVTGPTFGKVTDVIPKPKPKINPYLAHQYEEIKAESTDAGAYKKQQQQPNKEQRQQQKEFPIVKNQNESENKYVDARLEAAGHDVGAGVSKRHRRRRELKFVEPGTFVDVAERKRQRAANAESAGFVSGRKTGQYVKSTTMSTGGYYGTTEILDDIEDRGILPPRAEIGGATLDGKGGGNLRAMPLIVEWWDMELLPSKLKKQVANYEGKALSEATKSQMQQLSSSSSNVEKEGNVKDGNEKEGSNKQESNKAEESSPIDEAEGLRIKCAEQASLKFSRTRGLIQHIVPIKPFGEVTKKPVEPVLYLTEKERKKARKRRREQKQQELRDLQAVGLIEPPEPRLTLSNFIRVMGDQAYVDPSQMERTVQEQVQKRQLAHLERNAAKKLTKEQRWEKRHNKIAKDASTTENSTGAIHIALFYVKNASHPYHRTKIDLNAQQLDITGGVVECDVPNMACVICEGGPKAIQKYTRLMLVRMKWTGPDDGDDDDEEEEEKEEKEYDQSEFDVEGDESVRVRKKKKFDKDNKCELLWSGMATKRQFKGFIFQHCETSDQARKVLKSKGVEYYWEQILSYASGRGDNLHLKLVDGNIISKESDQKSHDGTDDEIMEDV